MIFQGIIDSKMYPLPLKIYTQKPIKGHRAKFKESDFSAVIEGTDQIYIIKTVSFPISSQTFCTHIGIKCSLNINQRIEEGTRTVQHDLQLF